MEPLSEKEKEALDFLSSQMSTPALRKFWFNHLMIEARAVVTYDYNPKKFRKVALATFAFLKGFQCCLRIHNFYNRGTHVKIKKTSN